MGLSILEATMKTGEPATNFPAKIGSPARRALITAGYTQLEQLSAASERELLKLHGMGPKAMGLLRQALHERGLAFAADKKSAHQQELDQ
jgi:hypothetical protein